VLSRGISAHTWTCVITKLTVASVASTRARMRARVHGGGGGRGSLRFDITLARVHGDLITRVFTVMRSYSSSGEDTRYAR